MVNFDPSYRIDAICSDIFRFIWHDYTKGRWDYDETCKKAEHYREVGHQLAQELPGADRLKAISKLETCFQSLLYQINEYGLSEGLIIRE